MEMFHLSTVSVNILVVTLSYSFTRCYHWRKPGKKYIINVLINFSVLFIRIACESIFQNKKFDLIKKKVLGFPGGAVVESLPANAGHTGSSPGLGRSHMPQSN